MQEIIETTLLEFDKSSFLLYFKKYDNDKIFVEILQTFHTKENEQQSIKINPTILNDIIKVLQNYDAKIPKQHIRDKKYLNQEDQKNIVNRYLKGITIKDLALQFDQSRDLIEMILRNKGIEIVSQEIPKKNNWRKKY